MKQILALVTLLVLASSAVFATDLDLNPDLVNMATTDVKIVDACLSESGGAPAVGYDLIVDTYCKDLNGNEVCDGGDIALPAEFSAVISATPTDVTGCGKVTLTTSGASGTYAYKVNGVNNQVVVASEHGLVLIPELTTIGAAMVLGGAGLFMYRKRRN